MKTKRLILTILLVFTSCLIFAFSNQTGISSSKVSDSVAIKLVDTYSDIRNKEFSKTDKTKILKEVKVLVRKTAHFTEYLILAVIFYLLISTFDVSHPILMTIFFVFVFASTDEIHQLFVAGRSGRILDILIDTIGGAVGSIAVHLLNYFLRPKNRRDFEKISFEQFAKDVKNDRELYDSYSLPARDSKKAAGYDIYLLKDVTIKPGETKKIPTGLKSYFTSNEVLLLIIRSSAGFNYNIRLCNQVGVIDADYYNNRDNEGHIWIKIQNEGTKKVTLKRGEAIVQGLFINYLSTKSDRRLDITYRSDY